MITRSRLVEKLRNHQIRSHHKFYVLTLFSPKPHIYYWADVAVAIFWALVFSMLVVLSYLTLINWNIWFSIIIQCAAMFLLIHLRNCRRVVAKKRDQRGILLPVSKW